MKQKTLTNKAIRDHSNNPIPNYYWEYDIKEAMNKLKELTGTFIWGDNPPHFSINEDNIEEYFEEVNKIFGLTLTTS